MTAPATPDEALAAALLQPASITDDAGRTIANRSLAELQDAIDRETAKSAAKKKHFGLRFTRLVPPGAWE